MWGLHNCSAPAPPVWWIAVHTLFLQRPMRPVVLSMLPCQRPMQSEPSCPITARASHFGEFRQTVPDTPFSAAETAGTMLRASVFPPVYLVCVGTLGKGRSTGDHAIYRNAATRGSLEFEGE